MKIIICHKLKEGDSKYFMRGWCLPFQELTDLGWISLDPSEIKGSLTEFFREQYDSLPKVVLFWSLTFYHLKDLILKYASDIISHLWVNAVYLDDLHHKFLQTIYFKNILPKFDHIFVSCAYVFPRFYPRIKKKDIIWYPHHVNHKFSVKFNETPLARVLLSGSLNKLFYPFRNHVYGLSLKKKYPIDVLGCLSYQSPSHQFYGHHYIKYLSRYVACVTCCSTKKTPYLVKKFFEIPASGSLLLAYDELVKEPLKQLGFIDGVNYLSVNYENVHEKILFVTDPQNKEIVDHIRLNGFRLVWNQHTLLHRIQIIEETFNKIC